jgi:hypothetical protein
MKLGKLKDQVRMGVINALKLNKRYVLITKNKIPEELMYIEKEFLLMGIELIEG